LRLRAGIRRRTVRVDALYRTAALGIQCLLVDRLREGVHPGFLRIELLLEGVELLNALVDLVAQFLHHLRGVLVLERLRTCVRTHKEQA
jgi:hypothetical protein